MGSIFTLTIAYNSKTLLIIWYIRFRYVIDWNIVGKVHFLYCLLYTKFTCLCLFIYSWSWWWVYRLCSNPLVPGPWTTGRGYAIWSTGWCMGHRMCVCWTTYRPGVMAWKVRCRSTVFNKKDFRYISFYSQTYLSPYKGFSVNWIYGTLYQVGELVTFIDCQFFTWYIYMYFVCVHALKLCMDTMVVTLVETKVCYVYLLKSRF